ncbi:MAG: oxidoreductase [Micrococcales bacterium]|nr:MAG: oxidoreductase [Micrococcales bacterium]PIE26399.1 MAG: oxidoreductase [Micrococcales bacterium]
MPASDLGDPTQRPGRIGVGVVSAGRVGSVLGSALRAAGHSVVGVNAVSQASRERAGAMLPAVPVLPVPEVVERAELVLLAVPDAQAPGLVDGLARIKAWQPGQLVVHTSRVHGLGLLDPAMRLGAIPIVLTPFMTFTGYSLDLPRLAESVVAVTAPAPVLPIAQALVVEMGGEPVEVADAQRPLLHAAVSHGTDHVVALVCQVQELLGRVGIAHPHAAVGPLMRFVVEDALDRGHSALSGPVSRGDASVVEQHLAELSADARRSGSQEILASYLALARSVAERAVDSGQLSVEQAQQLLNVLAG